MRRVKLFGKRYRIKRKKSIFKNRFFWLSILVLIIFGVIFYFLIFASVFQVKEIVVSGNERVLKEEIETIVKEDIKKRVFFLPTKSIFFTNLNQIKENLLNNFPQIVDVKIGRGFPDILKIIIVERLAMAIFCQVENCFLLDAEGIIFEKTQLEDNFIKIISGQEVGEIVLGKEIIEKEYLEKIFKIQEYISEEFEFGVEEFIVFEERLNIKTTEDWQIFFDPKGDLSWQLTKLHLVLEEKIPSEKRKDLEYIELRFGDLASFRYKER